MAFTKILLQGDAPQVGAGVPVHSDVEGALYWDSTGDKLYANSDGGTTWVQVGPGAAGGNTLDLAYDQGGAGSGRTINVDSAKPVVLSGASAYELLRAIIVGDTEPRVGLGVNAAEGYLAFGDGSATADVILYRRAANVLAMLAGDSFEVNTIDEINGGGTGVTVDGVLLKDGVAGTAIHKGIANEITGISQKTVPASSDEILLEDSAASYVKKSATLFNVVGTYGATILKSKHQYVWRTEEAAGDAATTGVQTTIHATGADNESITRITVHAPVTSASGTFAFDIDQWDNEDLGLGSLWTLKKNVSWAMAAGTGADSYIDAAPAATLTGRRPVRIEVNTVPADLQDWTIIVEVERKTHT